MSLRKLTHIDYAILGLLKQRPVSGYKIRMTFKKTALGNFSSSPGTIYPALKRLETLGMVKKKSHVSKKGHELFTITKTGIRALTEWLQQPVMKEDVAKNLNLLLLRFAFMDGLCSKENMQKFLESFKLATAKYIAELVKFQETESRHLPLSGRLAFAHGIASYKTTLRWCKTAQLQVSKNLSK
ncbi:MAG: PadR family transcriptional regulator [Cyclobacteriaceae bacterium]|nr:PadR family transcriptional regulator [Cyclobacteriaceae bacterium]